MSLATETASMLKDLLAMGMAETVVYRPAAGGTRNVVAAVDRQPAESLGHGAAPLARLTVAN